MKFFQIGVIENPRWQSRELFVKIDMSKKESLTIRKILINMNGPYLATYICFKFGNFEKASFGSSVTFVSSNLLKKSTGD